jgi:4-hydroxybutyrate CoA-transferase
MEWVDSNPLFYLVDVKYLEDIRIISAHDNMVAINNALAVDLTGQINSESINTRLIAAAGGQIPFAIGALMSKGGRSVTVLPSTIKDGAASRIVSMFDAGTTVTLHRNLADYVVTEFGIAKLRGKTLRERAQELVNISHPNFRDELTRELKN